MPVVEEVSGGKLPTRQPLTGRSKYPSARMAGHKEVLVGLESPPRTTGKAIQAASTLRMIGFPSRMLAPRLSPDAVGVPIVLLGLAAMWGESRGEGREGRKAQGTEG